MSSTVTFSSLKAYNVQFTFSWKQVEIFLLKKLYITFAALGLEFKSRFLFWHSSPWPSNLAHPVHKTTNLKGIHFSEYRIAAFFRSLISPDFTTVCPDSIYCLSSAVIIFKCFSINHWTALKPCSVLFKFVPAIDSNQCYSVYVW